MAASRVRPRGSPVLLLVSRGVFIVISLISYSVISTLFDLEYHDAYPATRPAILIDRKPSTSATLHRYPNNATTIGYVVTITDCGSVNITSESRFAMVDGAAVLAHAIHRASIYGSLGGRYDYRLYAVYHPSARTCVGPLRELGYELLERDTPINVSDIKSDELRENIRRNGCCGERELIKFEAFKIDHPAVVIVDLDVLILKPLDPLFDFMLLKRPLSAEHLMWKNRTLPEEVWLLYTTDYNMVNPQRPIKPVQGGFVVIRPNETIYNEIMDTVVNGTFGGRGWDNKSGKFHGVMTFQGLMPYYFLIQQRGHAVELNRCLHDNMAQSPRDPKLWPGETEHTCYSNDPDNCEDCREQPVEEIYSTHFTSCLKPWSCMRHNIPDVRHRLCRKLHHEWFATRSEMERTWGRPGLDTAGKGADAEHFLGHCSTYGRKGYVQLQPPYGKPLYADRG